jgi:peptidoglycan/xylan/chitin deacetylase (PgdA/CDA1 family)
VLQHGAPAVQRIPPPGTVVSWVPDTPPLLALTIDDGVSSPVVGGYVALAKATGIRLTFFANGVNHSWADHQKDMQPLVDSGQIQIANHTWDHPDIRTLTDTQLVDQLCKWSNYVAQSGRALWRNRGSAAFARLPCRPVSCDNREATGRLRQIIRSNYAK